MPSLTVPIFDVKHWDQFREQDLYDRRVQEFVNGLCVTVEKAIEIEGKTKGQSNSDTWWKERMHRFTASDFGELSKRQKKNCNALVERKKKRLGDGQHMPPALRFGKDYESTAARRYQLYMVNIGHKVKLAKSGLIVRPDMSIYGASPDRIVCDPVSHPHTGIVEIKCLHKARDITPKQAALVDDDCCLVLEDGTLKLKREHRYFYQVQGQMALSGAKWCDFVAFTFKGLFIERIKFEPAFWEGTKQKLADLYFQHFIPAVLRAKD